MTPFERFPVIYYAVRRAELEREWEHNRLVRLAVEARHEPALWKRVMTAFGSARQPAEGRGASLWIVEPVPAECGCTDKAS
jgi:hypothetical protein